MNYKKARSYIWIVLGISLIVMLCLMIIFSFVSDESKPIVAIVMLLVLITMGGAVIFISVGYNCCPSCGGYLDRNYSEYCQHCGVRMEDCIQDKADECEEKK